MLPPASRWRAAATANVALLPPPLTLPLPPRCHQAAAERVSDFITQLFSQL
jgi:hypothetical protein